jgi:alpha-beta hydrolase superfamily lysophospholipase
MDLTPGTVTADDGTELRLWELSPPTAADEAVLFVHGSITNARALFAPPVEREAGGAPSGATGEGSEPRADDSYSWLQAAVDGGRAAFALDVRGYGDSERPPELDEPPEANDPPVRAPTAADDIAAAYAEVDARYDAVHLVGVSWGTMTCGYFCANRDHDVASLAQVAPVYLPPWPFEEGIAALGLDPDLDAYYYQEYDEVKERQGGDEALFEAVWTAQVESNQGEDEGTYVAQSGALADTRAACEGQRVYDAADVAVPTQVIRGTADAISVREDALTLYDELGSGDDREYAEIGGADHYAMHGARRQALYAAVAGFQNRA